MDTIFAVATGAGRAGIAVIRISGPTAGPVLEKLAHQTLPAPRRATRCSLFSRAGEVIDDGLALWFPSPQSFTGEDVVELHLHGGPAVVAAALDELAAGYGLRPAEPGEFTRRAFENGKLDLTAAEGLGDLVDSETEAQRRQALRQMRGELSAVYDAWRERLLGAIGHLEATIDFSDEDLPEAINDGVFKEVESLKREIGAHLTDGHRGERIRAGIRIAIVGAPNAGKSSLLNIFAKKDAAIVSRHPGTTRDVIEVPLDLGGFPVVMADTAGIREAEGEIEEEGVRRARTQAANADLKLAVFDGALWPEVDAATKGLLDANSIVLVNKSDLGRIRGDVRVGGRKAVSVSVVTSAGIDKMLGIVEQAVRERFAEASAPALTRVRHRLALEECHEALCRYSPGSEVELAAEDLRLAARALGRITGRVDVEEVLDVIFRDFCIGK